VKTVWVLGDQLDRGLGALTTAVPGEDVLLMVESEAKLRSRPWHRQRLHLVLTAMRRFAGALREEGFDVDYREAATLADGVRAHVRERRPAAVRVTEPASWDARATAEALGCELVRSDAFLCHYEDFAAWAAGRTTLRLADFYRWQRRRLGYLMDGDEPAGGRWSFDVENRLPPPRHHVDWPRPALRGLDALDRTVLEECERRAGERLVGAPPTGLWPTSRADALALLDHVVRDVLPSFGPYEDAMLAGEWRLNHTLLSPALNLGLLRVREVCDRVEQAYRAGRVPIASAEGFLRQVIGWREYVWGLYWLWMPAYREANALGAERPLPPLFCGAGTRMRCVERTLAGVHERGWAHHIQRLMVLGNLSLLAGVRPGELVDWMWSSFVDGAEWVMLPNVVGMALYADGGRMATKPYAAGGNYVARMSDYCGDCAYDPRRRVGETACPLTTLYWEFLARHRDRLGRNHRLARQVRSAERLSDLDQVRARAREVLERLDAGRL
jgi:deoxyribodipyrimidine photolyase-related protein